jgi:multidrug resistance efflux pump
VKTIGLLTAFGLVVVLNVLMISAQDQPAPLPAIDTAPYRSQVAQLEAQLLARDNELLHVRAEWATCRASLDSADLTAQAFELVRRCEAATGGKCTWDDKQRRVVKIDATKEPSR